MLFGLVQAYEAYTVPVGILTVLELQPLIPQIKALPIGSIVVPFWDYLVGF